MPKALTAAHRGEPSAWAGQATACRGTVKGPPIQSNSRLSSSQVEPGGIMPCVIASTTFTRLAIPAVSSVWPMFAFTLPIGICRPAGRCFFRSDESAPSSVASPTCVLVAWASMYSMRDRSAGSG